MKVLYINYLFDRKFSSVGAAVHVEEFVRAAQKCGIDIKACYMNKFRSEEEAVGSKSRAWLKQRLSKYVGQLNALISNIGYFRREWALVKQENPDALLVRYNLLNFSVAVIAKLKKIPLILEVNSPMALENKEFNDKVVNLPFIPKWIELLNLKLSSKVYTVSEALKSYFISNGINDQKIEVIPNGVDVKKFRPDLDVNGFRDKYSFNGKFVIGFVGSFHYWHGVEALEEYVEHLCSKYDHVVFLFIGDGPLKTDMESTFKTKGLSDRVIFTGYTEHHEIPTYLAAMDAVIAPYPAMSFFYFSPLKLFEYMAAGKPVIASRVGQIEEIVTDGKDGLLYDAGNMEQLIECSCKLIENEKFRKSIGRQARDKVCGQYSWEMNAQKVVGLIQQSLN